MTDLATRSHTNGTGPATPPDEARRGFRPAARRRNRIVTGSMLAAIAVAGNVWLYSNLDADEQVLQLTRDVLAGEQLTDEMLRPVAVEVDDSVSVIPADQAASVLGTHAKVRLVAGSLLTQTALQAGPLVATGSSIVAVRVPDGSLPLGLRERVPVEVVLPAAAVAPGQASAAPEVIVGRVVGLPSAPDSAVGLISVSLEVAAADAARVAAAGDVRIVLREPSADPAIPEDFDPPAGGDSATDVAPDVGPTDDGSGS